MRTMRARLLTDADLGAVERLLDLQPYAAAQVAEDIAAVGLCRRTQRARVYGFGPAGRLDALCWSGANVVPVGADRAAALAFAEVVGGIPRGCSSMVGSADAVLAMWQVLGPGWGPARDLRACQPLLATASVAPVAPDPAVRLVRPSEVDRLYPAAVAMYLEEVGISPVAGAADTSYRDRIAELVGHGRMYARFLGGQVVFKAELAVVSRHTAQIQGVWTEPTLRGRGLATAGVAAVVADALARVAPTVSLYVNDYNHAAITVYRRCGFRQVGTFATILF